MANFLASLIDASTGISTLVVNDECSQLAFSDESNYDDGAPQTGHARSYFDDYRKIVITTGSGNVWTMGTSAIAVKDQTIAPADPAGFDSFTYNFQTTDEDGIFTVVLTTYPTWDTSVNTYAIGDIVYYSGSLYKALTASTASQPDTNPSDWEVYSPTDEEALLTPYVTEAKVVVLCISILKCYADLIHTAFCLISTDFCNDDVLCKNKKFLTAIKLFVLLQAIPSSVNNQAWNEVEEQVRLMKTICNCK